MINNKSKKVKKEVEEVLPLLTAKEANTLANTLTKEMELQLVADKIRAAATGFKYKLELVDIKYGEYIYGELKRNGYAVIFKGVGELTIMWDKV